MPLEAHRRLWRAVPHALVRRDWSGRDAARRCRHHGRVPSSHAGLATAGCPLAMERLILPELAHVVGELAGRGGHRPRGDHGHGHARHRFHRIGGRAGGPLGPADDTQGPADRLPPPLGDRPLQLSLHLLPARGGVDPCRSRRHPCRSRRSSRSSAASPPWACAGCASPAASRRSAVICRADPAPRAWPASRALAVDQRPPPARARRGVARGGVTGSTSASTRSTPRSSRASPAAATCRGCGRHRGGPRRRLPAIKINTVVVKGFDHDEVGALCDFAWSRGLVPGSSSRCRWPAVRCSSPASCCRPRRFRALVVAAYPGAHLVPDDGGGARGAGPARYWRLVDADGGRAGEPRRFGIISAMTEHFCDACNRVRLSASARCTSVPWLDDAVDLRDVLRCAGEPAVLAAIRRAVTAKRPAHNFGLLGIGGPRKYHSDWDYGELGVGPARNDHDGRATDQGPHPLPQDCRWMPVPGPRPRPTAPRVESSRARAPYLP